jgi:hypothetical protein
MAESQYQRLVSAFQAAPAGFPMTDARSLLWPSEAPQNWETVIRIYVTRARKAGVPVKCKRGVFMIAPAEPMEV